MSDVETKKKELLQKRGELEAIFQKNKDENGAFKAITSELQAEIIERNNELEPLQKAYDDALKADAIYQENLTAIKGLSAPRRNFEFEHPKGGPEEPGTAYKSAGEYFTESEYYTQRKTLRSGFSVNAIKMGGSGEFDIADLSVKTLMTTTAGFAPFVARNNMIVYTPQRRLRVADLIPQVDTTDPGVRYMEETTFTNNAAAVAEAGTKPESALGYTERFIAMSKIATTLPVTEEQLADIPQIRGVIDNRLTLMLGLEEERELLSGSGSSPEMYGFLNKSGIQTQAKGADDDFTAILKMITKIENTVGFANVTGTIMNPNDWLAIRTIKDTTGRFILGDPDQVTTPSLWGKAIVSTISEPAGTILMGDFQTFSQILRREGITFRVGYVNDQLLKNQITIVIEERLVLAIYRANAFGTVTGTFGS